MQAHLSGLNFRLPVADASATTFNQTKDSGSMKSAFVTRVQAMAVGLTMAAVLYSPGAGAREQEWEGGLDVIYQNATTLKFAGGTTVRLDSDYGLSLSASYYVNEHLLGQVALDWAKVDYNAAIKTASGTPAMLAARIRRSRRGSICSTTCW
jgi:hypothetical protein